MKLLRYAVLALLLTGCYTKYSFYQDMPGVLPTFVPLPTPLPPIPKVVRKPMVAKLAVSPTPLPPGVVLLTNTTRSVTVAWNASTDPTVAGYNVYLGYTSKTYMFHVDAGKVTQVSIPITPSTTYYIAATSYTTNGLESVFSNEIVFVAPPTVLHIVGYSETNSVPNGTNWGVAAKVEYYITNAPAPLFFRARTTGNYQ